MWACASSSWMIDIAEPKLFSAGACCAARRYEGALTSSVSADTVRIRRMPSRYLGDMCWRPSTSFPAARWACTCSSVQVARSSIAVAAIRWDVTLDLRPPAYSLFWARSRPRSSLEGGVSVPEMLIGGEWRQAAAREELEVLNPANEAVVDTVPAGSREDVELAVATAKRAF